jgi:23S rRNA pseudouridine1911/1915/1917 synthase
VEVRVPPDAAGITLGRFLLNRLKLSRTALRRMKQQGGLLLDGEPVLTSVLLRGGETLSLVDERSGRVAPEEGMLTILYEDPYLLAVDKPAGVVVHPVRGYTGGTLANTVAWHLQQRGEPPVARPVQRLDRETSGLLLFAKESHIHHRLSAALDARKLDREYLALVAGVPDRSAGTIDIPLRRTWGHSVRREPAVGPRTAEQEAALAAAAAAGRVLRAEWTAAGSPALTHFRVLQAWETAALLSLRLETGRTHQIRVHLAWLGHPVLGDELYGRPGPPGRQALHAASLAFRHPMTGQDVQLASPLPADMRALIDRFDRGS